MQARAATPAELDNTIKLLVSANTGSSGWDKWGTSGYWIKYREFWSAKAQFDITTETEIQLPFRIVDDIIHIYVVTGTTVVDTVYYMYNDNKINVTGYAGQKIIVEMTLIKNVRDK